MINSHLHILHIPGTPIKKINDFAEQRLKDLMIELENQNITDYTIIDGFWNPDNPKEAIHSGHRRIVELAKKQGFPNVIIAEDDIVFTSPDSYKYFLSSIPDSYDIFSGLLYEGVVEDNKLVSGGSAVLTLYSVHERFYDTFLDMDTNTHVDRNLALTAHLHEYIICNPYVVQQRSGWSFNRMHYTPFEELHKIKTFL